MTATTYSVILTGGPEDFDQGGEAEFFGLVRLLDSALGAVRLPPALALPGQLTMPLPSDKVARTKEEKNAEM